MEDLDWHAFAATMTGTVYHKEKTKEARWGKTKRKRASVPACPCQDPAEAGFALWRVR
jgi:hypothetical protein